MAEVRFGPDRALSARTLVVLPVLLVINGVALVAVGAVLGATALVLLALVAEDLAGWLLGLTLGFLPVGAGLSLWVVAGIAWGVGLIWAERNSGRNRLRRRLGMVAASPETHPELFGIVQRLCALADIEQPAIMVADYDRPNALLIGRSLCVTTELPRRLTPAELEAVLAHELGHLRHRDGALMEWALSSGVLVFVIIRSLRKMAREEHKGYWVLLVLFAAVFGWVYLVNRVLVSMLSRTRELAADRAAAALTGRPSALASALVKLDADTAQIPTTDLRKVGAYSALMCVGLPGGDSALARMVRTHPALRRRLDRLAALSDSLAG